MTLQALGRHAIVPSCRRRCVQQLSQDGRGAGPGVDLQSRAVPLPSIEAPVQVGEGKTDERTQAVLKEIAIRGEADRWREWARGQPYPITRRRRSPLSRLLLSNFW